MSEDFSSEQLEYFAQEDAAIRDICNQLGGEPYKLPETEIQEIRLQMQTPGTAIIHGEGFEIRRTMDTFFELTPTEEPSTQQAA